MTYVYETISPANLISRIASELVASGWTNSAANTWTCVSGSGTLKVEILSTALSDVQGAFIFRINDQYVNIWHGNQATATLIHMEFSATYDFFYLSLQGTIGTGAEFASQSSAGFATATYIEPYFVNDSAAGNKIAIIASSYNVATKAAHNAQSMGIVSVGMSGAAWAPFELLTMRPAVQDIVSLGEAPPSNKYGGGISVWPYVVCENTGGVRGRLRNIYFLGESYNLGDDVTANRPPIPGTELLVSGLNHIVAQPYFSPNGTGTSTQTYSPFGVPSLNNNSSVYTGANALGSGRGSCIYPSDIDTPANPRRGPNILIKKGDGA